MPRRRFLLAAALATIALTNASCGKFGGKQDSAAATAPLEGLDLNPVRGGRRDLSGEVAAIAGGHAAEHPRRRGSDDLPGGVEAFDRELHALGRQAGVLIVDIPADHRPRRARRGLNITLVLRHALASATGSSRAFDEHDVGAIVQAARDVVGRASTRTHIAAYARIPLAPWFVLGGILPLAFLLWRRNA